MRGPTISSVLQLAKPRESHKNPETHSECDCAQEEKGRACDDSCVIAIEMGEARVRKPKMQTPMKDEETRRKNETNF